MFGKGVMEKISKEVSAKVCEEVTTAQKKVLKKRDIEMGNRIDDLIEKFKRIQKEEYDKLEAKRKELHEMMEGYEERVETYAREAVSSKLEQNKL